MSAPKWDSWGRDGCRLATLIWKNDLPGFVDTRHVGVQLCHLATFSNFLRAILPSDCVLPTRDFDGKVQERTCRFSTPIYYMSPELLLRLASARLCFPTARRREWKRTENMWIRFGYRFEQEIERVCALPDSELEAEIAVYLLAREGTP